MDAIQTLKQFIEERRKNSGLRLSREIPCTYQLVRFWLRGERRPGRRNARKLAQIMVADGFLSDAEARSFLSSLMIDDPQGKSDSGLNINILLSDVKGRCDDDASTSHAAPVARLPKHTGTLSGDGGGSLAEAEKGGRPDSGTASASDLKPSEGCAC